MSKNRNRAAARALERALTAAIFEPEMRLEKKEKKQPEAKPEKRPEKAQRKRRRRPNRIGPRRPTWAVSYWLRGGRVYRRFKSLEEARAALEEMEACNQRWIDREGMEMFHDLTLHGCERAVKNFGNY